jgi:DNA polymerase III alpha subunit
MNKELISQIIPTLKFNFPYNLEEYSSNPIMENFHYHTSYSNVMTQDSPVSNEDYAKRITELNGKCLFSGEHGWQGNVFEVHDLSEKYNLKYRHSVEAYWVKNRLEKDRTNCHINLIAKNNDGKGDINFALSEANVSGYYGKPRIDLELLFNIPKDNIIVTSACVAGWNYENAKDIWLKIWNYFGDNFFLEIQNHNTDLQKRINETILEISEKYGIQIIDGLDSHYINKEKDDIKREKLLEYSDIHYADEDGWNLDYPNINTVIDRLHTQNILNDTQIYTAIMNTNIFNSDSIEDIKFDRNFKIPNIYKNCDYNERVNIYKSLINKAYKKEKNKSQERIDGIRYEAEQVIDSGVVDYFLDTKAILDDAINNENGKLTTTSRGSMASFYTNKLLGFTTIDRFNAEVPIYPERFLTKERVLAGQMPDCDFNIASQEPFRKAAKKILGEHGCYPLMAIEKLKPKNAWKMYASINNVEPTQANEISKCIDNYEEAVKNADDEFKEDIDVEDYIPDEYKNLFNKSIEYRGIVSKIKVHACFEPNTLVLTNTGYKKIKDIKIGDLVLTHKGNYEQVLDTQINNTNKILKIKATCDEIITTPNHPFFIRKNIGNPIKKYSEPYWEIAKNLTTKDYIGMPINHKSIIPKMKNTSKTSHNFLLDLSDKNSWWLIGRYIGDGWIENCRNNDYRICICCNKNKEKNELKTIINKIPKELKYHIDETRTTYKIMIYNKSLFDYLSQFGKYAYGKHLTNDIIDLPIDLLKSFLIGYLSADGYKHKDEKAISFCTVSKELALGLQQCIHKVYKTACTITISKEGTDVIEERIVNRRKKYRGRFAIIETKNKTNEYIDGMVWFKIKSILLVNEKKDMYNLSVNKDNSYTVNNVACHNCGHLLFDGDIRREIGLISAVSKSKGEAERIICAACEGSYLDSYGYVKEDFLIVDAVSLINEYWESINKPIPTFDELRELIKDDDLTWGVYAKGITCCVNQMEKQPEKCKKFKPSNLAELAGLIAGIRPGFKSLINIYINRQPYTTGEEGIDNLLKESSHFMIFQESIMRVLGYLSVSMRDTYGVIKSISKKKLKGEKKEHLLNQLKNSWKDKFSNTDNFNNVWKVISDAARYSFNAPHALSMAGDSAYIAYFKAHYTSKFYEVSINHYLLKSDKDKMNALITEASQYYGYKLGNFKFGQDNRLVHIDDNNKIIYSSLSGIKGMQNIVPQILFDLGKEKYKNLFYLFQKLLSTNINKKSLNILINLNYFSDYGDINYINQQLSIYKEVKNIIDKLYQAKQINKKDISNYGLEEKEISKYCNKETDKQFREINNEELKKYLNKNYNKIINYMTNKYPYKPCELMDIMKYQVYYLGQTNIIDSSCDSDIYIVQSLDVNNYGTAFAILYQCCSGQVTQSYKIDRKWYAENPCQVADIIRVAFKDKFKHVKVDDKWVESNDVETIISNYFIMERVE